MAASADRTPMRETPRLPFLLKELVHTAGMYRKRRECRRLYSNAAIVQPGKIQLTNHSRNRQRIVTTTPRILQMQVQKKKSA